MDIYQLHLVSTGVGPQWLIEGHRVRVPVEGNHVNLDGKQFEVYGCRTASGRVRTAPLGLASGTLVEVWCDANGMLVCARADEVDRVRATQVAREEATQVASRVREQNLRAQAHAFNANLRIPLKWVPGAIEYAPGHPQGISDVEEGCPTNVVHVLLEQGFRDGRLMRSAGDLLCMRSRRDGGEHFPLRKEEKYIQVSCKACLTAAQRWRCD